MRRFLIRVGTQMVWVRAMNENDARALIAVSGRPGEISSIREIGQDEQAPGYAEDITPVSSRYDIDLQRGKDLLGVIGPDLADSPLSLSGMSDRSGQRAAYLRDLDSRGITGGYGRQIQERNYYPAQSAFFGEGVLEGLRNTGRANYNPTSFESFLETSPTLNMGGRARDAFTHLANYVSRDAARSPEQRVAIGEYTNPDPDSQRNIFSNLSNLASQAARSSFNPLIGNQMFRSDRFTPEMLQAQFMGQQGTENPSLQPGGGAGGQGNFIDFLRTRFGL